MIWKGFIGVVIKYIWRLARSLEIKRLAFFTCMLFLLTGCHVEGIPFELELSQGVIDSLVLSSTPVINFSDLKVHQSMAFHGGKALFVRSLNGELACDIYDIVSGSMNCSVPLPFFGYTIPHANVSCLGTAVASSNSLFPVLYVSAWNDGRQAFVYDIVGDADEMKAALIQVIDPRGVNPDILGRGYLDWVVDEENGSLYSVAYGARGSAIDIDDNLTHITQFRLPSISLNRVELNDLDVVAHFILSIFRTSVSIKAVYMW